MSVINERRHRRSENIGLALQYMLDSVRHAYDLDQIAIAGNNGLLVAGAGSRRSNDVLAAYAPMLHAAGNSRSRAAICESMISDLPSVNHAALGVEHVNADGDDLYVCSLERKRGGNAGLHRATAAISRILSANAA